jgi:Flp pilus assembly protein TadD
MFKAAIKLNPGYWRAYYALGYAYKKLARLEEARGTFETMPSLHSAPPQIEQEVVKLVQKFAKGQTRS